MENRGQDNRIALLQSEKEAINFSELQDISDQIHSFLHMQGVEDGARVALNIAHDPSVQLSVLLGVMDNYSAVPYSGLTEKESTRYLESLDVSAMLVDDINSPVANAASALNIQIRSTVMLTMKCLLFIRLVQHLSPSKLFFLNLI